MTQDPPDGPLGASDLGSLLAALEEPGAELTWEVGESGIGDPERRIAVEATFTWERQQRPFSRSIDLGTDGLERCIRLLKGRGVAVPVAFREALQELHRQATAHSAGRGRR